MRAAIVDNTPGLSAYVAEMCRAWGLTAWESVGPDSVQDLDAQLVPVVVCPAGVGSEDAIVEYAMRGGVVVCFLPTGKLAEAAGIQHQVQKETPLRLRIVAGPASGLAGETLPIVGRAGSYEVGPEARVLAYLSHPGRYDGESPGIVEADAGKGRIVSFAFDLARCVLMLRQGDPARAERLPDRDPCARPSHLAAEIGPPDAAWIPYADLLARLLVDLVCRSLAAPVPLLYHLPGTAGGILLYSGDEDTAEVVWNDEELEYVAAAGGRMNLYIIPVRTNSTAVDVERYAGRNDVGPHPNLRPLDGEPVPERIREFERQILLFEEMFGRKARSLRNHCTAWAGYMEPVEAMERLGVRMDTNYFSGTFMRDRESAPYAGFGGALPMRFCRPDGRLLDVYQQHTHLADDVLFGTSDYSYRLSPEVFEVILERIFADMVTRFHTPYGVCVHPSNWVKFSGEQGRALLRQAADLGVPVWSFDQWLDFQEARDTWRTHDLSWRGSVLRFTLAGSVSHDGLSIALPATHGAAVLKEVRLDGAGAAWEQVTRYGLQTALVSLPTAGASISAECTYGPGPAPGFSPAEKDSG